MFEKLINFFFPKEEKLLTPSEILADFIKLQILQHLGVEKNIEKLAHGPVYSKHYYNYFWEYKNLKIEITHYAIYNIVTREESTEEKKFSVYSKEKLVNFSHSEQETITKAIKEAYKIQENKKALKAETERQLAAIKVIEDFFNDRPSERHTQRILSPKQSSYFHKKLPEQSTYFSGGYTNTQVALSKVVEQYRLTI